MSGEFERIAKLRARAGRRSAHVPLGIGDDAALLAPSPGMEIAFSSDLSVEAVHFRVDWAGPELAGAKALLVSISDMAAMGAEPRAALVSVALPATVDDRFVEALYTGLLAAADRFGVVVAGGDFSSTLGPVTIDTIVLGEVERGRALRRSGARPGDILWVSGVLGSSAEGLRLLAAGTRRESATEHQAQAISAHLEPEPRVALGRALVKRSLATAAIDLSDGLSSDVRHLCNASNVGVVIDAETLPRFGALEDALHGGEQYELLFASPADREHEVEKLGAELRVRLTPIGVFAGEGVRLRSEGEERPLPPRGWDHFRR